MRSAVFGRYWSTAGGAEKYGGVIAQHLARSGPVDLLAFEDFDVEWLAERLQLDLTGVSARAIDDAPGSVTGASADYDRFVNVSFMSADPAAHRNSIYVVHFPTPLDGHVSPLRRAVLDRADWLRPTEVIDVELGSGFHPPERGRRGPTWTSEQAALSLTLRAGTTVPVELVVGHHRPMSSGSYTLCVDVDGIEAATRQICAPRNRLEALRGTTVRFTARGRGSEAPVRVTLRVDSTFVPADVLGSDDHRVLGAPITAIRVGRGPRSFLAAAMPEMLMPRQSIDWVSTYGSLVANSEFTRHWVRRYWDQESDVLYPPVTLQPAGAKEPIILNVGRFFAAEQGHSKKQLELVRAFRVLCDRGHTGWTLHLVGGCARDGEPYLERVRKAAAGYPVELHVNARGDELRDLYARASIYWHASGLGENARRHPDRLEHFGIATVEAMSAGAVPVVVALAGQLETVRHGLDGYHFETISDLVDLTAALMIDPTERERMSASAMGRARFFSVAQFEQRLDAIFDRLHDVEAR
ncbi:MAG: glycosyltransferase [Actinomycetota bacterium]